VIPCVTNKTEVRDRLAEERVGGRTVGLVPTMGALHEGHLSLIRRARAENDTVVVSVFVNPTQFGPGEDLQRYPRDLDHDVRLAQAAGADLVFSPPVHEMYGDGFCTWVLVEGLTSGLCGRSRPGHFRGVCTVVTKLLDICGPDRAYFGEKDAQQLAVIKKMVSDLDLPVEIVACPTMREVDGLAMSSRNARLSAEDRAKAPLLYQALLAAEEAIRGGERDPDAVMGVARSVLAKAEGARIDYLEIVRTTDLTPVGVISGECLVAAAAWFGETRLIDNVTVRV
jgi:pantoate--beta-alanine ligase